MRAFTVIAGGMVPVLVNTEASINALAGFPVIKAVITIITVHILIYRDPK
jgi:hypothetical protein